MRRETHGLKKGSSQASFHGKSRHKCSGKKVGFSTVHSLREKSWKRASLTPSGKAVKAAEEGNGIGEMLRVSQEKNCWCSQNRISYLQPNTPTLPGLIKPFTAVAGKAEGLQNLLARLGRQQEKPWTSALHSNVVSIPKGKGEGAAGPAPSLSFSAIPSSLTIDLQNDFSLCSFADTLHRAQAGASS